ncbi:hypothetical protein JOD20_004296 [Herpetosiphon giganteus]|nr:hypothetical protein [Herpetosiphon giganteus]
MVNAEQPPTTPPIMEVPPWDDPVPPRVQLDRRAVMALVIAEEGDRTDE